MGDVVHNLPMVSDIAHHVPDARIDWVVEESFADLPALHPAIRTIIPVALRRWRRSLLRRRTWQELSRFVRTLRTRQYDVVLDSQGLVKSSLIAATARGPAHGYDRHCAREPLASFFYQHTHFVPRGAHAVVRNRALGAAVFGYTSPDDPPDYGIRARAQSVATLPHNYVVFLHATSRDSKLWPEPLWIELGADLSQAGLAVILPWGSDKERARAERLARQIHGSIILPRLGLAALAAILEGAQAVVGVDTGLVHLAAALRRPTVAIYTDTDPALTGVAPSDPALAVNLGNAGAIPSAAEVLQSLGQMRVLPA